MLLKKQLFIAILSIAVCSIHPRDTLYQYAASEALFNNALDSHNIIFSNTTSSLTLQSGAQIGYITSPIIKSEDLFNELLPSWNGFAPLDLNSSFKVQMRFNQESAWSPWLTVGFWKNNIWENYGLTKWDKGIVEIDYVKLKSYSDSWQFKILMLRKDTALPSPEINSISFFISDSKTTTDFNIEDVLQDNPPRIFVDTYFLNQYSVDPLIGSYICSPTMVSMILGSYDIEIDTLKFSKDNRDPYWEIYGVWPRSVQNGFQAGVNGFVSRYRSWSETRAVLEQGGRIGMSVGPPLYRGHIIMLAGFDKNGNPIVHDPAREDGYAYIYNKEELSKAWFNKGGIAYTFYKND